MIELLSQLIALQKSYGNLSALEDRLGAIPAHIEDVRSKIKSFEDELAGAKAALDEVQKTIKSLEIDVQTGKDKIAKHLSQLNEIKTNETYRAMLKEIDEDKAAVGRIEEQILEKMYELETCQAAVDEKNKEGDTLRVKLEAEEKELEDEAAVLREKKTSLEAAKAAAESALPPEESERFYRIASARHGVAVARAFYEKCGGCGVAVRPQMFQEIKSGQNVRVCETCSRILYWEDDPEEA